MSSWPTWLTYATGTDAASENANSVERDKSADLTLPVCSCPVFLNFKDLACGEMGSKKMFKRVQNLLGEEPFVKTENAINNNCSIETC